VETVPDHVSELFLAGSQCDVVVKGRVAQAVVQQHVESTELLQEAQRQARDLSGTPLQKEMISLVANTRNEVMFVSWTNAHQSVRLGRIASLDASDRVKPSYAMHVPECSFVGAQIVVTDTGVRMNLRKKDGRQEMPAWCILLRDYLNLRLFQGPLLPRASVKCVVCVAAEANGAPEHAAAMQHRFPEYFGCKKCLLIWHKACAQVYYGGFTEVAFTCPLCASDAEDDDAVSADAET
jgi:hypothetical protein